MPRKQSTCCFCRGAGTVGACNGDPFVCPKGLTTSADIFAKRFEQGNLWPDGTGTLSESCQRTDQEFNVFSDGHNRTKRLGMAVLFRKVPFLSDHESPVDQNEQKVPRRLTRSAGQSSDRRRPLAAQE
jgi:hypothetical protein